LQYRINNGNWEQTATSSRSLKLASLSPGDYTILFKLENNPHFHAVTFSISKPWYTTWWFVTGSLVLILGSAFYYFRWRIRALQHRNKLLSEKIELEESLTQSMLTSIKSQMNPHFFYNALNTIQFFIFTNDRQNASIYLSKFSKLTRMILEMSDKEQVMLREEINALTLYLDIEKVRFDGDFDYTITIDGKIDTDLIRIPSMIIQPYIENAIKHGLLHKKGQKTLQIAICCTQAGLEITIDDNGIGREMANELNKKKNEHHRPFATSANQKRLELLNKGRHTAVGIKYIDKTKDGRSEGTTVTITIPLNS
jgi:LytS/YehU family sensor histidine kinase